MKKITTIFALAIVLILASLMLVACDTTIKDNGGAIVVEPSKEDNGSTGTEETIKKYILTVNNGKGVRENIYNEGTEVTVTADTIDKTFICWEFEAVEVSTSVSYTFKINNDVTVTAIYADSYSIYLDAGEGIVASESATALYGYKYTLPVPELENYYFLGWYYGGKAYTDNKGVAIEKFSEESYIILDAKYQEKPRFDISVTNGDGAFTTVETVSYHLGETVEIKSLAISDRRFTGWLDDNYELISEDSTYSFVVSSELVFIASYTEAYRVEVTGGSGTGTYDKDAEAFISFSTAPAGKEFAGWKIKGEEEPFTLERSFTHIVEGNIAFEVVTTLKSYSLTYMLDNITYGEVEHYNYNQPIEPRVAPQRENYTFSGWIGFPDTAKMPSRDIVVNGRFTLNRLDLVVINGTGGGRFGWGENVTITATEPEGKSFSRWIDTATSVQISTNNPYTFSLENNTSLTAEFSDISYNLSYVITVVGEDLNNLPAYGTGIPKSVGGLYASFPLNFKQNSVDLSKGALLTCDHYKTFSGWSDVPTLMPSHDVVITGTFTIQTHTVSVTGGTMAGNVIQGVFDYNTEVTFTADLPIGYEFVNWKIGSVTPVSTQNPYTFRIVQDGAYTAEIKKTQYSLTYYVKANYEQEYTVHSERSYYYDDPVNGLPSPTRENHDFGSWTTIPQTMPANNVEVFGIFYHTKHLVTINGGLISKINGTAITPTASGTFEYNDTVTIIATPTTGKEFQEWTPDVVSVGTNEEYTFILTKAIAITARYKDILYNLSYFLNDEPYSQEGQFQFKYKYKDPVDPLATPTLPNHHFVGRDGQPNWTLANGDAVPSIMPAEDLNVYGSFVIDSHTVQIENGSITKVNGEELVLPVTDGEYDYGTELTIVAELPIGKWFKNWITDFGEIFNEATIPHVGDNGQYEYTLGKDIIITATFTPSRHTVTIVDSVYAKIVPPLEGITFDYNTEITVSNTGNRENVGQKFLEIRKDGIMVTGSASYTFYITADTTIEAVYEYIEYNVRYVLNGGGYIDEVYETETYIYTDIIHTLAPPDAIPNYHFEGWKLAGYTEFPAMISNITDHITITGKYTIDSHTITLTNGKITEKDGIALPSPVASGTYDYDSVLTIVADNTVGQYFDKWIDDNLDTIATSSSYEFTVKNAVNYTALNKYYDYEVKYYVSGAIYQDDTPYLESEYLYHYNDLITYLPMPSTIENYVFIGWYLENYTAVPTNMPNIIGDRVLNVYGRYEHIYSYSLSVDQLSYIIAKNSSVEDIYPTEITIPNTYNGKDITEISANGFENLLLTSINVSSNILTIGASAFAGCTSLQSIKLPFIGKAITATGQDDVFKYIFGTVPSSLISITITDDLAVGDYAFDGLSMVETITLPQTLVSIGSYAFNNCSSLSVINIYATVNAIGDYAFSGCSSVQTINYNATNLGNLSQNNNIFNLFAESITIRIGSTVTAIPSYLFCPVIVDSEHPSNVGETVTVEFLSNAGSYLVATIGEYAFSGLNINNITLPSTITSLGNYAFYMSTLSSINIDSNITSIGTRAFADIDNLSIVYATNLVSAVTSNTKIFEGTTGSVIFGSNVTKINNYLFLNSMVSTVSFAEDSLCTTIESFAFAENAQLHSIELPILLTQIGASAFEDATNLSVIDYYASNLTSGTASNNIFDNCGENTGIVVNIGIAVTSIPDYLFYSASGKTANITNIVVASNGACEYIGKYAFYGASNLVAATNFEYVHTIGTSAFENCSSLTSFYITAVTKNIGARAFKNCEEITINCEVYSALESWDADWNQDNYPVNYGINNLNSDDYSYVVHNNKAYITRYIGVEENVVVPTSIETYQVVCFGNAFKENISVVSVTLPISIDSIIDSAFNNCINLVEVSYSGDITYLGKYAFNNCTSLTTFSIPSGITIIYEGTFNNCTSLVSNDITPLDLSNIVTIQKLAFFSCSSIELITLPLVLTKINELTFAYCTALESIFIPSFVTEIAENAFIGCTGMEDYIVDANNLDYSSADGVLFDKAKTVLYYYPMGNVASNYDIADTVIVVGENAFNGAVNLISITIPTSVEYILENAFAQCINLTSIYYSAINADTNNLCVFAGAGSANTGIAVIIGNSVTTIPDNLFNDEDIFITSLTLGSSVSYIGQNAFLGADITTLTIPESVTTIGNNAFNNNAKLITINYNATSANNLLDQNGAFASAGIDDTGVAVNIGSNVVSVPDYLFGKGTTYQLNITAINFSGNSLLAIGKYAFYGANVTTITIIESVTTLGEKAFADNTKVTTLTLNASNIGNNLASDNVFENLGSDLVAEEYITVTIGTTVTNIPDYFNYNLTKVGTITMLSTVLERVGKYAFKGTAIDEISLPGSVTNIDNSAFEDLVFTALTLPFSLINIGTYAFKGMENITSLTLPSGLKTIGDGAFAMWVSLTAITIPESVIQLGINAFSGATSLEIINYNAIAVADNMGNKAFVNSGAEETPVKINIGSLVTRIPNYLFTECEFIYTVIFSGNTVCTTIGEKAFYMLTNLVSVIDLPTTIVTIGVSAFEGCSALENISLLATSGNLVINESAFRDCTSLVTVTFANNSSLQSIGDYAFYNCITLESVIFGTGSVLQSIGNYAFAECIMLDLVIPSTVANVVDGYDVSAGIGMYAFENCASLTSVVIPSGVFYIMEGTFKNCTSLVDLTVHSNIVYIGDSAFENCTSLTSIEIPEKATYLGASAFKNCTAVNTLAYNPITSDIDTIDSAVNETFSDLGKESLTGVAITISAAVKYIPSYLFYGTEESSPNIASVTFATSSGMSAVSSIGEKAFYYAIYLQNVVLPEGLQVIGMDAFAYCSMLEHITIPSSVATMRKGAFQYATMLTSIAYNAVDCEDFTSDYVNFDRTNIFNGAGSYSDELYTNDGVLLTIGNSVTALPIKMFYSENNTSKIKAIVFENAGVLTDISAYAFSGQTYLTTISAIPDTITSIGESAFYNCSSLVSDMIMASAEEVWNNAFYNCSLLTKLHLAENLNKLGISGVYMDCSSVTEVNINSTNLPTEDDTFVSFNTIFKGVGRPVNNEVYGDSDGFVLNIAENVNYLPKHFMHNYEPFMEEGVIEQWTLNISEIVINNPNLIIGDYAFSGVGKLQQLTLGKLPETDLDEYSVQVGAYAFYACPDLTTVTLNNVLMGHINEDLSTTESSHVFAFSAISTLKCSNGAAIPLIGKYAFYECSNLSVINPDHGVYSIFHEDDGSTTWHYDEASIGQIGEYAFANTALVDVYLSSNVSEIGAHAFENCTAMTTFRWPESVLYIRAYAFNNCSSLEYTTFLQSGLYYDNGLGTIIGPVTHSLYVGDGNAGVRGTMINIIEEYVFFNTNINIIICGENNLYLVDPNAFTGMNGILSGESNLPED